MVRASFGHPEHRYHLRHCVHNRTSITVYSISLYFRQTREFLSTNYGYSIVLTDNTWRPLSVVECAAIWPPYQADLIKLVEAADYTLFQRIISTDSHVLFSYLPPKFDNHCELCNRHHVRQLIPKTHIASITILSFIYFTRIVITYLV